MDTLRARAEWRWAGRGTLRTRAPRIARDFARFVVGRKQTLTQQQRNAGQNHPARARIDATRKNAAR
eukprot:5716883-Lingulodinium_polyedra.AAC.1